MYVGVRCRCGHSAVFAPSDLAAWLRGQSSIESVAHRLKCTACGQRGASIEPVDLARLPQPTMPAPLPGKGLPKL